MHLTLMMNIEFEYVTIKVANIDINICNIDINMIDHI